MTRYLFSLLFLMMVFVSCQNNDEKRLAEQEKGAKSKELIFNNIEKGWVFTLPVLAPDTGAMVGNWQELLSFLFEILQKPKSSIGAFQKKAKVLAQKASELNNNIPPLLNKPEVKSRISVLTTKFNSICLYIQLDNIPDKKIVVLIEEVNIELLSLYNQMNEIVRKSQIPKEEGEPDMIRMLDTARAIPNQPTAKILPKH